MSCSKTLDNTIWFLKLCSLNEKKSKLRVSQTCSIPTHLLGIISAPRSKCYPKWCLKFRSHSQRHLMNTCTWVTGFEASFIKTALGCFRSRKMISNTLLCIACLTTIKNGPTNTKSPWFDQYLLLWNNSSSDCPNSQYRLRAIWKGPCKWMQLTHPSHQTKSTLSKRKSRLGKSKPSRRRLKMMRWLFTASSKCKVISNS